MAKVLLVEDDNNLREIFEMRLQAEGYQTLTASDGEEALVVAMKEKPDLIVADVMMPKLSGFEMLETMRAAPEMSNVKVIMMTALGQAEDQARGEKLGVVKYLVKSQVTLEDFARVVREVLQPGASAAGKPSEPKTDAPSEDASSNNNKQESEKSMPEDSQPSNSPAPGGDSSAPGGNPIAGGDSGTSDPMSSAQAQSGVQNQINDFVGSGAPSSDAAPSGGDSAPGGSDAPAAPGGDSGGSTDVPVVDAPAPAPGEAPAAPGGDSAPSGGSSDADSSAL